jgi:hypothetical protein
VVGVIRSNITNSPSVGERNKIRTEGTSIGMRIKFATGEYRINMNGKKKKRKQD